MRFLPLQHLEPQPIPLEQSQVGQPVGLVEQPVGLVEHLVGSVGQLVGLVEQLRVLENQRRDLALPTLQLLVQSQQRERRHLGLRLPQHLALPQLHLDSDLPLVQHQRSAHQQRLQQDLEPLVLSLPKRQDLGLLPRCLHLELVLRLAQNLPQHLLLVQQLLGLEV
jgi:hypothetical protein